MPSFIARRLAAATVLMFVLPPGTACADRAARTPAAAEAAPAQAPPAVLEAAKRAVTGLEVTRSNRLDRKNTAVYKLAGTANGKPYNLMVDASGQVLRVKQAKDKKADKDAESDAPNPASPATHVGAIAHAPIRESSGVVASRRHAGVLWTHNDKGNAPALYAIDRTGRLLAEFPVAASADDWEDVATDDAGNLYVGNIGNNGAKRATLEVHRLREPNPADFKSNSAQPAAPLQVDRTWRLRFPAQPFDCESLVVRGDHAYVVSKKFDNTPAEIYRFPIAVAAAGDVTLEKVATLPTVTTPVTAADWSRDGRRLALLSRAGVHLFDVGGDLARAANVTPTLIPVPRGKLEGLCFTADGLLLTSEGRQIYALPPQ
jgi:hypothetical protein